YVPVSMALALGLAVMIGGRRRSGAAMSVLRALFLLPYASSVVAVALVWQWMYHPDFGLINQLLTRARLGPVNWLGDPRTALGAADVIVSRIYRIGWELLQFGDASALALLLVAVLFGATWAQLKLLDGRVEHA